MDIGSVKPVLTGVTSPVPKTPTEQSQSTTTDLKAEKAVKIAEKADNSSVDTATDKPSGQRSSSSTNALTKANTVKAAPLDQATSGFEAFISDETKATSQNSDSPANATVVQDNQEFAMRMQAMIDAWQGTGGATRNSTFDRKL